jgi:hypothetical protein
VAGLDPLCITSTGAALQYKVSRDYILQLCVRKQHLDYIVRVPETGPKVVRPNDVFGVRGESYGSVSP